MIQGSDDIASRAIDLLKEIYTNLGPKLQANQVIIQRKSISLAVINVEVLLSLFLKCVT